jgi:hypothetical protein
MSAFDPLLTSAALRRTHCRTLMPIGTMLRLEARVDHSLDALF